MRLGRALGYGARHAAKTLAQAVDAATAPNPAPTARPPAQPVASAPQPVAGAPRAAAGSGDFRESVVQAQRTVAEAQRTVSQTQSRVRGAAKQAGKSALAPVAKFSSVLWLEVTGTFFGLVAFAMGEGIWRLRTAMKLAANDPERMKLYACVALMALFAYFAVSNFVRASRRQRR
ncbi:hypothetical protein GOB94_13150 [Granulicella sp. 5B5]|nr:hypothetical protein GOB94_13150 [Granulicella sp. 5B5]